jgi:hypothetical protein
VAVTEEEIKEEAMKAEGATKNPEATTEEETTGVPNVVETAEATTEVTEVVTEADTEETTGETKITEAATTKGQEALVITRVRERLAQETHLEKRAETRLTVASNNLSRKLPQWLLTALR